MAARLCKELCKSNQHNPLARANELIAHGRESEARRIIWSLQPNAHSITEDDAIINQDVAEITQAIREEQAATEESSFMMVFKNGPQKFLHRTLLGMGGQMMQQLSGVNLITYVSSRPSPKDS
ncbi:unnamed protein product [Aspergillus oryzae]|uniref:Unnamed protein product n=1 Tax=Aspergillus oryzae var. brunneus TaxID=332754 RepID=A0ABQ6L174_ASPOZ|nr:unnamed protein product [Aspergillus oryzae]GMF89429.1 unnamed protein product [Aspergillus oryzae]GMG51490.1 unnamed protein product [Aspergillus oryzae var. brunneus]